ncbi:MAG: hypothetical protein J5848_07790 [Bacteroidales bacterium]|nr:hypothetical protein [Bacteroidales bacterium]
MKKIIISILLVLLVFGGDDVMAQNNRGNRGNRNTPARNNNVPQPKEPSYFTGMVSYIVSGAENIKTDENAPAAVANQVPALDVNATAGNTGDLRAGKEKKNTIADFYYLEDAFYGILLNTIALTSGKEIHLRYGLFRDAVKVALSEQDCLEEFYDQFVKEPVFKKVGTTKSILGRTATLYKTTMPELEAEFWVDETVNVHQNCGLFFNMPYLVLECDMNIIVATGSIRKLHLVANVIKDTIVDKKPLEGLFSPEYVPADEIIHRLSDMMR